jgi:type II secretory pathway component PulF
MPTFSYHATDTMGNAQSGLIEAANLAGAAAVLREQGLTPNKVTLAPTSGSGEDAPGGGLPHVAPFLMSVPLPHLAVMFRQFSTLLRAGVPMVQGLTALMDQTQQQRLKEILRVAASQVAAGNPLSRVLERYPNVFTPLTVELIRAGEHGGMMEAMCARIADYLEREIEIRRKLQRETLYPKIVLSVAGLVLLILAWARAGMGQAGVTAVLVRLSLAAIVGGVIFGGWWLGRYLHQYPALAALWDQIKMAFPGVGKVTQKYATARFCRALGTLYAGGILLPRAVEIAARACGNRYVGQRMLDGLPVLLQGGGLSGMLEASGALSPLAVQMARTGEQTGSLDDMMQKVADYLESEADAKAHQLAVGIGVAMLLIAAIVVFLIVLSFYMGMVGGAMSAADGGGE